MFVLASVEVLQDAFVAERMAAGGGGTPLALHLVRAQRAIGHPPRGELVSAPTCLFGGLGHVSGRFLGLGEGALHELGRVARLPQPREHREDGHVVGLQGAPLEKGVNANARTLWMGNAAGWARRHTHTHTHRGERGERWREGGGR